MATLTAVNPKLAKGPAEIVTRYAPTSVSWAAGQFLTENTSGLVMVADNAGGPAGIGLKYQALTARASGDAAGYVQVLRVSSDQSWEMHVASGTVSAANIGIAYGVLDASGVHVVDLSDTTDPCFIVQELGFNYDPAANDSSDTLARIRVKVKQSAIDAVAS